MVRPPAFLIVGTPRSGTTLVQRLAAELPGVRVPPETHFFDQYAFGLLRRVTFPLDGPAIEREVSALGSLGDLRGSALDPAEVRRRLRGRCGSVIELFSAVVGSLSAPARTFGEKTPRHLHWWRPVTTALPRLKLVCVVRDARAVVASNRRTPWGRDERVGGLAQEWAMDQRRVLAARRALQDRLLVVRYEDVVEDEGRERRRLAAFLGKPATSNGEAVSAGELFLPWEAWKRCAAGRVRADRREAWRRELSAVEERTVRAVAYRELLAFGFVPRGGRPASAPRGDVAEAERVRRSRRVEMARIGRIARAPGFAPAGSAPVHHAIEMDAT